MVLYGFRYLLTMIDRATRFSHAVPISDITAHSVAEVFFTNWIPFFGVPEQIVSDRGAQFSGSIWENLCKLLGIQRVMTSAYRPTSSSTSQIYTL